MLAGRLRFEADGAADHAPSPTARGFRWLKVAVLTLAVPATLAALAAAGWAVVRTFLPDGPGYPAVVLMGMCLYLAGMFATGWAWRALVERPPALRKMVLAARALERREGGDRPGTSAPRDGRVTRRRDWLVATGLLAWRRNNRDGL